MQAVTCGIAVSLFLLRINEVCVMEKLIISVQTGDWYDDLFGAEAGADEAFAFIKSCGFDALDYNLDHTLRPSQVENGECSALLDKPLEELLEYYRPVKEAAEKHGIRFSMAHAPFPSNSAAHPEHNDYVIKSIIKIIYVCGYLRIPNLVVHPIIRKNRTEEWEMNMQMYPKLIDAARENRVKICLENLFSWHAGHSQRRACAEAGEACRYIDTLNEIAGEDIFGFCYDVGHGNILGCNIYEDLKQLGHRLTTLHIHDNDGRMDLHCIPYTIKNSCKNTTDWEGFTQGLKEIGYEGPLNFEIFAALKEVPRPLVPEMLKFIHKIGEYFRDYISK